MFEIDEGTGDRDEWFFRRTLIAEGSDDSVFTLEDGTWRRIVGRWLGGEEIVHRDYATGAGYTVRFGDGEFGRLPAQDSLFEVEYRLGSGASGNVPAGAVSALEIPAELSPLAAQLVRVTNPFPVTSGVDPESAAEIKLLTPEAYKSETFFAVRPEDYGTQAEKLDFVQRAQGTLPLDGFVAFGDDRRGSVGRLRALAGPARTGRGAAALPPSGRPGRDREGSEVRQPRSLHQHLRIAGRLPGSGSRARDGGAIRRRAVRGRDPASSTPTTSRSERRSGGARSKPPSSPWRASRR